MKTLKTPNRLSLSVANIGLSGAAWCSWNGDEDGPGITLEIARDYELVLPAPTYGDAREHRYGIVDDDLLKALDSRAPDGRALPPKLREAFEDSDGHFEWKGGFSPMMNYVWPVCLAYEVTEEQAAQLIAQFAPTCTLVSFTDSDLVGEEHGIALAGGGMNLADQLAIAYLCCGCVPPTTLLEELPGVIGAYKVDQVRGALRQAYKAAADYHAQRAQRMRETAKRVLARKVKGAA